jgi:hypothetical protein
MKGFISSRYSIPVPNGHVGSLVLYMRVFRRSVEKHLIVVENVQRLPATPEILWMVCEKTCRNPTIRIIPNQGVLRGSFDVIARGRKHKCINFLARFTRIAGGRLPWAFNTWGRVPSDELGSAND